MNNFRCKDYVTPFSVEFSATTLPASLHWIPATKVASNGGWNAARSQLIYPGYGVRMRLNPVVKQLISQINPLWPICLKATIPGYNRRRLRGKHSGSARGDKCNQKLKTTRLVFFCYFLEGSKIMITRFSDSLFLWGLDSWSIQWTLEFQHSFPPQLDSSEDWCFYHVAAPWVALKIWFWPRAICCNPLHFEQNWWKDTQDETSILKCVGHAWAL